MILAGTLICTIAAAYVSLRTPQTYRVSTILEINPIPDSNDLNERANRNEEIKNILASIESPEKLKALIEMEIFNDDLKNYLKKSKKLEISNISKFFVAALDKNNLLRVTYNTPDAGLGVNILNSLKPVILEKYENKITSFLKSLMQEKKNEIADLKDREKILTMDIANTAVRIEELQADVKILKRSTDSIIRQRDQIIDQNQSSSMVPALLYSNLIQQNRSLMNTYKNNLIRFESVNENNKLELRRLAAQIQNSSKKLEHIEKYQKNYQYISIAQPPEKNIKSIKPSRIKAILIGAIIGLSITLFLAFFMDYIVKALKEEKIDKSSA